MPLIETFRCQTNSLFGHPIYCNISQGVNESASFRFLQRLSVIETVRDLLLPVETTVHEKWLPAQTVRVILLPSKTLGRKLNHTDSLCRKLFNKHNSLGRKQDIADSLGGSQI